MAVIITCTCVLLESYLLFDRCKFDALNEVVFFFSKYLHVQGTDPEKRQQYCHSPERASRSAKRVKVTQRYVVPLQPPSHIKMDYLTCYTAHNRV